MKIILPMLQFLICIRFIMNISRNTFNQYIADSDFRTLFIREMMWNNPMGQTQFDIVVEDVTYTFEQIAQRNGFQVLTCKVDNIPTSSLSKKIDTQLRKQANDYICIYGFFFCLIYDRCLILLNICSRLCECILDRALNSG